jgi:hypothetical protein
MASAIKMDAFMEGYASVLLVIGAYGKSQPRFFFETTLTLRTNQARTLQLSRSHLTSFCGAERTTRAGGSC